MRAIAPRLGLVLLVVSATAAASYATRSRHAADSTLAPGEIRVHVRPGASYARMDGDLAVMRLLRCPASARDERGRANVPQGRGRAVARNAVGDQLEIPEGAGPEGMAVEISRRPGGAHRQVEATADAAVTRAVLSIDVTGCEAAPGMRIVLREGGNDWTDVGGTMNGTAITAELPHLSVYAIAGN